MIRGSCLCGGVAWEAPGPLELVTHCHCSMCRKAHGAAFATYGVARAEGFGWRRGLDAIRRYRSSPALRRPFCGRCGSVVPGEAAEGRVFVPVGNLEDDPGARPAAHIFVASRAAWHAITDELPRFDGYPPGFPAPDVPRRPPGPAPEAGVTRGSCLCGAVAYRVEGPIGGLVNCHCSRCRRARSAAHATNGFVEPSQFQWVRGEDRIESFKLPEARSFTQAFCGTCGSSLPRATAERVVLPAGGLDDDPGLRERLHIHVGSRAPWFEITDDLPRFEEGPPS